MQDSGYGGGNRIELIYGEGWQVLEELNSGGASQRSYVWGLGYIDALVLRDQGSQRMYVHQDANWNVTSIADTAGTVQERYRYDPYGNVQVLYGVWWNKTSSSYQWKYLHQGLRYDSTATLYDSRNRIYDADLGRFANPDPIGYEDGMNVYQAYRSGPVTHVDPTGLFPWDVYPINGLIHNNTEEPIITWRDEGDGKAHWGIVGCRWHSHLAKDTDYAYIRGHWYKIHQPMNVKVLYDRKTGKHHVGHPRLWPTGRVSKCSDAGYKGWYPGKTGPKVPQWILDQYEAEYDKYEGKVLDFYSGRT